MILVILGLGLILRSINLNQSLWLDEGINVMAVKNFDLFGLLTQYAIADFHPPGWFVVLWSFGKLFGYSEIFVRLPSVLFGVFTIYITYLIGKKLVSKNVGLVSALLLSINPLHIYYSQEARMYALAALAVAVNMLFLIKIIKGEKVNLIFLIFSNFGILLADYVAYLIFPGQFVLLLFLKERKVLKKWALAFAAALGLFVIWLPIFMKQLEIGAVASANLPTWKFVVGGFDFKAIPLTFVKFIIGRIALADKVVYAAVLLPVVGLFIFLLYKSIKSLSDLSKSVLLGWVIMPPVIATLISVVIPIYSYFRLLFLLPVFVVFVATGILSFKGKLKYVFLSTVLLIQLFSSLTYLFNPNYHRENWKGLVSFFSREKPELILFESSGTFPPFDYYAKGNLNAKGALKDFPAKDETSVEDLDNLLKEKREVYLVDYLVQISDPNRLVAKKLVNLGYREKETKDFHGVGFVYHYVKN